MKCSEPKCITSTGRKSGRICPPCKAQILEKEKKKLCGNCGGAKVIGDEQCLECMDTSIGYGWDGVTSKPSPEPITKHLTIGQYDEIHRPAHYNEGKEIEPINVIEDWELGFHLGNTVKYISRHNKKGSREKDLRKALWYLTRFIRKEFSNEK